MTLELQPSKNINYVQLEKLCEIEGLKAGIGAQSTKEAHETFMKHYKKIFQKEKRILPYIPTAPTGKISPLISSSFGSMVDELHNISLYIRNVHGHTDIELALKFKDKMEEFIEILKKFPIHRNVAERHFVYKMMKTMPDLISQLTHEDFKALSRNITVETWLKGTTVLANESFYVILKGTVRPRCKIYKKMIEAVPTNFFSDITTELSSEDEFFQESPLTGYRSLINPHYIILGPWSGFGTLTELPEPKIGSNLYSLVMEDDCELLKINAKEYARVKEEQAKTEKLVREELIHKCPYYRNWPKLSVDELTVHIKWKRYPPGHVLVTDGEIISFVAYIQSGFCNVYREVIGLVKYGVRKTKKKRRRVFMGKLQEKESFGEISVLLQIPFTCTIITGSEVEMGIINAEDMLELDWVTRKLVLQTAEQTFGYLTDEEPMQMSNYGLCPNPKMAFLLKLSDILGLVVGPDCLQKDLAYVQEDVQKEYMTLQQRKEWKNFKDKVIQSSLDYRGIKPGSGKWRHRWTRRENFKKSVADN